jgi:ATP-dependent helicase HrpA
VAWLPQLNETRLLASPLISARELDIQLALLIADRAFLGEEPLPRSEAEYRAKLSDAAERTAVAVQQITSLIHPLFAAYHGARLALENLPPPRFREAIDDVQQQLALLMPPDFLTSVAWSWLQHFPRFLRAIALRLDKLLHGAQQRDTDARNQLHPWIERYQTRAAQHQQRGVVDPQLILFRWMLEELRVSLFAQQLGTSLSVSAQRLEKQWHQVGP